MKRGTRRLTVVFFFCRPISLGVGIAAQARLITLLDAMNLHVVIFDVWIHVQRREFEEVCCEQRKGLGRQQVLAHRKTEPRSLLSACACSREGRKIDQPRVTNGSIPKKGETRSTVGAGNQPLPSSSTMMRL